jgi:hypothetical protein
MTEWSIAQIVCIVFFHVLDGKVIHNKCEFNSSCFVSPQSWVVPGRVVAIRGQSLLQCVVGQEARLFEAIYDWEIHKGTLEKKLNKSYSHFYAGLLK